MKSEYTALKLDWEDEEFVEKMFEAPVSQTYMACEQMKLYSGEFYDQDSWAWKPDREFKAR